MKRWLLWSAKLGLSVFITWLALRKVPLAGIHSAFTHLDWTWAALSMVLFLLGMTLAESERLRYAGSLLREPQPSFRTWLGIYLESRPFFYILPAAVGAEGMVWVRLRQCQWRHASCGFVVLATRTWGVTAWSLAAAYVLARSRGFAPILARAPGWMQGPSFWTTAGCALAAASILAPWFLAGRRGIPLAEKKGRTILAIILATAASVLVNSFAVQMASWAAGTPFALDQAMGLLAFFNFAMVLPISLGGVGLQEALVLFLGLPLGFPPQALVAFSAVLHLQRLLLSVVGMGVLLWNRKGASGVVGLPSAGAMAP